jgi:nitrogen fixation protein FixH
MIKRITGRHVLLMLIAFFGLTITVNAIFITQAFRTFRGEDVPRSYMQGVAYNDTLDARAAQAELGWSASADVSRTEAVLILSHATGAPLTGRVLTGSLRHPADANLDIMLNFAETEPGRYVATYSAPPGNWRLMAQTQEGPAFEIEHAAWLR